MSIIKHVVKTITNATDPLMPGDQVIVRKEQWSLFKVANNRDGEVIRETTDRTKINRFPYYDMYRTYDVLMWPDTQEAQIILCLYGQLIKHAWNYQQEHLTCLAQLPTAISSEAEVFNATVGHILNGKKI